MRKFILIILLSPMLFITSCDPFGATYHLDNIEFSIEPEKGVYDLSDSISLTYSFELDAEKFSLYEYRISVVYDREVKANEPPNEDLYDSIQVYNDAGEDVTNKEISYSLTENKNVIQKYTLVPQKRGKYIIIICGRAYTRTTDDKCKYDEYISGHRYFLTIQ